MKLRAIEFRCPKCGGFEWGSDCSGRVPIRYCHGHSYDPRQDAWVTCRFSWPMPDDWRWFVARFADAQSYAIASLAARPGPVVVATSLTEPQPVAEVIELVIPARANQAERLQGLRAAGYDAHAHPTTGRLAVWYRGRWWNVMGGSLESPSLLEAKEQPPGPGER